MQHRVVVQCSAEREEEKMEEEEEEEKEVTSEGKGYALRVCENEFLSLCTEY